MTPLAPPPTRPTITLYTRPGCHLCDEMKSVVIRVTSAIPAVLELVDISTSPDLEARYGIEIPVLLVNGRKAAKYRVTDSQLKVILQARATE